MAKRYEELKFSDDFMFGKVMEDKELCRDVLECLLGQFVGELQEIQTERQFRYTTDGKPIRLDVYTKDQKAIYDAEMQNLGHKKIEKLELAKRSRFYQAMMDTDFLQKGNSYRKLPEGKVLFLCTFDPFGKGNDKYSFVNRCEEVSGMVLEDGCIKVFYNCTCDSEKLSKDLRDLYHFIMTGEPGMQLTERLNEAVKSAKKNEEWRSEYMKELLHDDDVKTDGIAEGIEIGRTEGIEIGRMEGISGFIQDKLEDGVSREEIVRKLQKVYSLSLEEAETYFKL